MRYLSASNAPPPSPSMAISLELWRETGHIMFKAAACLIYKLYLCCSWTQGIIRGIMTSSWKGFWEKPGLTKGWNWSQQQNYVDWIWQRLNYQTWMDYNYYKIVDNSKKNKKNINANYGIFLHLKYWVFVFACGGILISWFSYLLFG